MCRLWILADFRVPGAERRIRMALKVQGMLSLIINLGMQPRQGMAGKRGEISSGRSTGKIWSLTQQRSNSEDSQAHVLNLYVSVFCKLQNWRGSRGFQESF